MVGLIIATHGNTGVELVKSAEMFSGSLANYETWALNPGDNIELGEKRLEQYVKELDEGQGVLIMTDLFGGTPSNLALKISMREHVGVLTGVNFPMLIQFISDREKSSMDELITKCEESGKSGIMCPSKSMEARRKKDGRY